MTHIKKIYGLLSNEEIQFLNEKTKSFKTDIFQIYNTQTIKKDELIEYKKNLIEYVNQNFAGDCEYEIQPMWINKIVSDDVDSDKYHFDKSDISIVTYFNANFTGGDFEYIDDTGKKITIQPETNLSLVMNDKLNHRVKKVLSGERYSLIAFFIKKNKINHTLI